MALRNPDDQVPEYRPEQFPDEPDLKDFQPPAPVLQLGGVARSGEPGAGGPQAPELGAAPLAPAPLSMAEIDARIEARAWELAQQLNQSRLQELARVGALDLDKALDANDPAKQRVLWQRSRQVSRNDPELKLMREKARALGINMFQKSREKIKEEISSIERARVKTADIAAANQETSGGDPRST